MYIKLLRPVQAKIPPPPHGRKYWSLGHHIDWIPPFLVPQSQAENHITNPTSEHRPDVSSDFFSSMQFILSDKDSTTDQNDNFKLLATYLPENYKAKHTTHYEIKNVLHNTICEKNPSSGGRTDFIWNSLNPFTTE